MTQNPSAPSSFLPAPFLEKLVTELNSDSVRAIILRGSYARGDAVPPYSDVDITLIIQEGTEHTQLKRYIWRDGYAISVSPWSLLAYRERLYHPEEAIFVLAGIQEARILLDKDGAFRAFQQEAMAFQWEPLQAEANRYAGQILMNQVEIVLKALRALRLQDTVLLSDLVTLDLIPTATEAFAVQRGILVKSGNTYFHQVQERAGLRSAWTLFHKQALGIDAETVSSLEERGIAALSLFQETARLLRPHLQPEHWEAIEPLLPLIEHELVHKKTL